MTAPMVACTDFSPGARLVVDAAQSLSGRLGVPLIVVHAYTVPALTSPDGSLVPTAEHAAEAASVAQSALDAELRRLSGASTDISGVLRFGLAADEIVAVAKEVGATMIVVGSHNRSTLGKLLLGSVSERVLHHAPCPVLVVPAAKQD